jgi:hypothetical protein
MINDELISAYLDGELTAEEQSQVEQALVEDARLRRMFEDLRALRNGLQSMPRQKLDASFAERVLKAAQARKNGEQPPAPPKGEEKPEHHEPEVVVKSLHHGVSSVTLAQHEPIAWRVAVWSIAGIAAALLVALLLPERTSDIAHLSNKALHANAPAEPAKAKDGFAAKPADQQEDEAEAEKSPTAKQAEPETKKYDAQERGFAKSRALQGDKAGGQGGFENLAPAAAPTVRQAAPPEAPRGTPAPAAPGPTSAQALKEEASRDEHGRGRGFAVGDNGARPNARRTSRPADADDARTRRLVKAAEENETLVVRLSMPADAFQQRKFDKLMAQEGIEVTDSLKASQSYRETTNSADADAKGDRAKLANAARSNDAARFADRAADDLLMKESERADVVLVEASLDQVAQLIDGLEAQTGQQLAVSSLNVESRQANFDKRNERGGGFGGGGPGNAFRDVKPAEANRKDEAADKESERKLQLEQAAGSKPGVALRINSAESAKKQGVAREGAAPPPPAPARVEADASEGGRGGGSLAKAAATPAAADGRGGKTEEKAEFQQSSVKDLRASRRLRVVFVIEPQLAPMPAAEHK